MEQPPDPAHNNDEPNVAAEEAEPAWNFDMVVRELEGIIEDVHHHLHMVYEDMMVQRAAAARVPRGRQFRLQRRVLRQIGAQLEGVCMGYDRIISDAQEALAALRRDGLLEPAWTMRYVLQVQVTIALRRHIQILNIFHDCLDYII